MPPEIRHCSQILYIKFMQGPHDSLAFSLWGCYTIVQNEGKEACAVYLVSVKPQDVDDLIFGGSEERTVSER